MNEHKAIHDAAGKRRVPIGRIMRRSGPPRLFEVLRPGADKPQSVPHQLSLLTPLGNLVDGKYDRGRETDRAIVRATNETGGPVADALVNYHVVDPDGTGTGFKVDSFFEPVRDSFGITNIEGLCEPEDRLVAGDRPGKVTVRVTAAGDGEKQVSAEFRIEVSDRTPSVIELIEGGGTALPGGAAYVADEIVQLRDENGEPVDYGFVTFEIYDPNETGSFLAFLGHPAYFSIAVDENGVAHCQEIMWVGDQNPGKAFYLRASRGRRAPMLDIGYLAMPPESGPGGRR